MLIMLTGIAQLLYTHDYVIQSYNINLLIFYFVLIFQLSPEKNFYKMTSPYLPDDCIYYILKYLKYHRNNASTLFNCLLVNRFWCKATVPLLYTDPFDYNLTDKKKYSSIISTLISCFSKEEILQLKNQLKLSINVDNKININDEYKPLFEYPKYLESLDYNKIGTMISTWFDGDKYKLRENFVPTFYHLIIRRTISIKKLNISEPEPFEIWNEVNLTKLISLNSLNLLVSDKNVEATEFLSNMANSCLNLRKLEIASSRFHTDNRIINEKIYAIIQKQKNLKAIKLTPYNSTIFVNDILSYNSTISVNDILSSLEFQKHSLVYIELNNVDNVSFKNFINLCNLKYLILYSIRAISLDQCEILKYASFKLKRLEFDYFDSFTLGDNRWNSTSLMIRYLGTSLQELKLFDKVNISVMENISTYCLNLIKLEISIETDINLLMFPYFKNLKIRILNIRFYSDFIHDTSKMVKSLAGNLPINVKEVSLYHLSLLYEELGKKTATCIREFLENCHYCLEIINLSYVELEILKITLNYIERSNNSLKVLRIELGPRLNDEELKLLNQIKTKGVKIMDYEYNDKYDDIKIFQFI